MARYVPNREGLRALLHRDDVKSLVRQHGDSLVSQAGDGFVASYRDGPTRFGGIIYADTWSAKHRDARENILVRLIG